MTNFPVLLDVIEINRFLRTLSSDRKRITYLYGLKKELEIILNYYSDNELKNYIEKNNLRNKYGLEERNISKKEIPETDGNLNFSDMILGLNFILNSNLKMMGSKYSYLHFQIKMTLLPFINDEIAKIESSNKQLVKKHKIISLEPKIPIIPKSKQDAYLIKHYFDVAKKYGDVPMLKHLETVDFTKSFWSKKFNNIFFLVKICSEIETKLEDGKINETTRDLLIKLRNDINSRIPKAQEREHKKTSAKTSKQNPINENFEDESAYDRSQYYDKSPDE